MYPSSVNRGYFSYWRSNPPGSTSPASIHPLSIEAISPTCTLAVHPCCSVVVSILCQSRLFLLRNTDRNGHRHLYAYPSSVNRGYFSYGLLSCVCRAQPRVSILCQSRLFLLHGFVVGDNDSKPSIHPLSIEAISPTRQPLAPQYPLPSIHPLSIEAISPTGNRGSKSSGNPKCIHPLSIEAISPTGSHRRSDSRVFGK